MSKHTSINENLDVWTADSDGRIPITVSAVGDGGMERITTSLTPVECDTFIAAINVALGRPALTPLEERLLAAIEAADEHAEQGWSLGVEDACLAAAKGKAEGLRAALVMVREAGPTVPREAVVAVVSDIHARSMAAMVEANQSIEEKGYAALRGEAEGLRKAAEMMRALLNPTTKEPGHADD